MANKYQATDKNGVVYKRTSANRTYTHAVITHYPGHAADANWSARAPWSGAEWAGSLALAQKNASSKKHPCEIVEAVQINGRQS